MQRYLLSVALLGFVISLALSGDAIDKVKKPYKVVCYLGSWANYRQGDGKFVIEDIDPSLCTHLIYGFAKLGSDNKIASFDPYLDLKENYGLGGYERFTNLKKIKPGLKTLLAIGGWNEGSTKYSNMASSLSSRKIFTESCVQFLQKYGFDGLDVDWEYPSARGGKPEDKKNFIYLLKELREAFKPHNLLLTAAVSAGQNTIDEAYDIPALGKYLDLINLMAYDFHGGWDKKTGHNAPLYSHPNESAENLKLNVDYAVRYWLQKGAPSEKLILGMPLYGRSFTLQSPTDNGLGAPVTGAGMAGEFTRQPGFLGYNEICRLLKTQTGWKVTYDDYIKAPYIVKDRNWIGYDDTKSITAKVQYLLKMNLGGAMTWSIETDDFRGKCGGSRYPLLNTINSIMSGTEKPVPNYTYDQDNSIFPRKYTSSHFVPSTEVTVPSTLKVVTGSTKSSSVPKFLRKYVLYCSKSGYFRHPLDCKFFYLCQLTRPGLSNDFISYLFNCGSGTVFSKKLRICAFPIDVPGCF